MDELTESEEEDDDGMSDNGGGLEGVDSEGMSGDELADDHGASGVDEAEWFDTTPAGAGGGGARKRGAGGRGGGRGQRKTPRLLDPVE